MLLHIIEFKYCFFFFARGHVQHVLRHPFIAFTGTFDPCERSPGVFCIFICLGAFLISQDVEHVFIHQILEGVIILHVVSAGQVAGKPYSVQDLISHVDLVLQGAGLQPRIKQSFQRFSIGYKPILCGDFFI